MVGNERRNIILKYNSLRDYHHDPYYLGATVGPFANRLGDAVYFNQNHKVQLQPNDGNNLLHGGGLFNKTCWDIDQATSSKVIFSRFWKKGQSNFPTDIYAKVTYQLQENNSLVVTMEVDADDNLPIGPTNHAYFNLSHSDEAVSNHFLKINADTYTPTYSNGLPKTIQQVKDSNLDFKTLQRINLERLNLDDNFVLRRNRSFDCKVLSPDQRLQLTVSSTYPCIQIYAGKYLNTPFKPHQGLCLEPHFGANAPNVDFLFYPTKRQNCFNSIITYQLDS
jgi:aldose 1-epimerase